MFVVDPNLYGIRCRSIRLKTVFHTAIDSIVCMHCHQNGLPHLVYPGQSCFHYPAQSVCLPFLLAGIVHILHLNYSTANPDHRSSDQTNGSDLKGLAFRRTLPREMRLDRFQIHHFSASITVILQND